ncbi:hypothetical protein KBC89_02220 [Candidatus Woesebacteria bacterium]|nr:hypothetical protein [Candidatus Woesebacteria bacterium]
MSEQLIFFVSGLFLVLVSARYLLLTVQHFSARLQLSPLIVGTIIMAIGANLPELSLTITSVYNQDPGLALGNSVGSVLVNLGLIFGISIIFGKIRIGTHKTQIEAIIALLVTSIFVFVTMSHFSGMQQSLVLLVTCAVSFGILIFLSYLGRKHEDVSVIHKLLYRLRNQHRWSWKKMSLVGIISILGLTGGSYLVVSAVESFSLIFGISTTILGLTLTSLTTSLPELAVSILGSRAKEEKTIVGLLIGSSLLNLALFPAIVGWSVSRITISPIELGWLLLLMVLVVLIIILHKGKVVTKKYGLFLLMIWLGFVVSNYIFR